MMVVLRGALLAPVLLFAAGCGGSEEPARPADAPADAVPAALFVAMPPAGAVGVRDALGSAKVGDELTVRAVIGGRKRPFVDARAVMVVIDTSMQHCPDEEGCPTPWDYCCETNETLLANTMTVRVLDESGVPLPTSLKGVRGLEELATVVVSGSVSSTEGTLVLDAAAIHVAN